MTPQTNPSAQAPHGGTAAPDTSQRACRYSSIESLLAAAAEAADARARAQGRPETPLPWADHRTRRNSA